MSSKRQLLGPCAECLLRGRPCDGLYPECDYYRRSMPGPNLRPRQARIRNEQQYLSDRVRELEAELDRLSGVSGTSSASISPPASGGSPEFSGGPASPPPFDQPPTEMTGNWWSQNELVPATGDYLLKIFFNVAPYYHLHPYHQTFQQRLASGDSTNQQPHPSLLNAIYLIACASTYVLPQGSQYSLTHLEDHFLHRTRKCLSESLGNADRLLDYLRASSALSAYLNSKGRHLEGYHHHCGAARLALACDLHKLPQPTSSFQQPPQSPSGSEYQGLVPPITTPNEVAERIHTFWNLFVQDRIYALVYGLAPALDEETDQLMTPLPLPGYEDGNFNIDGGASNSISDVLNSVTNQSIEMDWLGSAFAIEVVSLALLHKAKRASATGPRSIRPLLLCNDRIINRAGDGKVDLSRAHSICIQSVGHLTAMEFLKSSTEPGPMSDPTVLQHARSIHESALGFSKRDAARICPLQRLCWQETSAWLKQYRERIISLRSADDPEVADLTACISFLDGAVMKAER